jgi:hypothetical protein
VFALGESFDEPLHAFVLYAIEQVLDAFLQALAENIGLVGEIVAEDALFRLDLIRGEKQRDGSHARNQREYDCQSRAHQDSPVLRGRYSVRGRIRVYNTAVR